MRPVAAVEVHSGRLDMPAFSLSTSLGREGAQKQEEASDIDFTAVERFVQREETELAAVEPLHTFVPELAR